MSDFIFEKASSSAQEVIVDFQICLALESEDLRLDRKTVFEGVKKVFRDSNKGCYYILKNSQKIVGCLLCLSEWSDWRSADVLWLHSVYILPEYRGQGLFRRMYNEMQKIVSNNENYAGIRLYVDKKNQPAIKVYNAVKMDGAHYQMFEWMKDF